MDNLPVHHAVAVKNLIESVGASIKFLPPYSPDLSPIELCWSSVLRLLKPEPAMTSSKLKAILRSIAAHTSKALDEAITQAIHTITSENAQNWFNHCGLFFESIRELHL